MGGYVARLKHENDAYLAQNGQRRRGFVLTFGCQQNEADSEKLSGMLLDMGYELCAAPEEADIILVNTCAIREHAEQRALSIVGQYKHLKAARPDLIIGVCGCMVTQPHRRDDIKFRYPYVDFVFGTSSVHRLPQLICERRDQNKRLFCPQEPYRIAEGIPQHRESTYRAWVSVMYGCNNFCSYCIVPYVRGRERSRRPEDVIREVRGLIEDGYRDITLLGQNVNSYGKDLEGGVNFASLLDTLARLPGDFVLRFMTSHPKDASRELIDVMAAHPKIARHFHLPLQAGSDRILKAMNRHYDTERYLSIVSYMREKIPDIAITSDIIVGFPGESEEDFEATLRMLQIIRFDMIYSFIYSPRKGTPAAEMEGQIPPEVQKERFGRLLELQNRIANEINQGMVGQRLRVLCDGPSKNNPAVYAARTEANKIVLFDGTPEDTGHLIELTVERADTFALYGKK